MKTKIILSIKVENYLSLRNFFKGLKSNKKARNTSMLFTIFSLFFLHVFLQPRVCVFLQRLVYSKLLFF